MIPIVITFLNAVFPNPSSHARDETERIHCTRGAPFAAKLAGVHPCAHLLGIREIPRRMEEHLRGKRGRPSYPFQQRQHP